MQRSDGSSSKNRGKRFREAEATGKRGGLKDSRAY